MSNSQMPSLNSRSLPFVLNFSCKLGPMISCQNLSSGAIRPGGLLFKFLVKTFISVIYFDISVHMNVSDTKCLARHLINIVIAIGNVHSSGVGYWSRIFLVYFSFLFQMYTQYCI